LGRKDARIQKQVQPFHIFDLPTNLDTGFLIELTAQHAQTENGAKPSSHQSDHINTE
jgi:hypothetical protein